MDRMDRDRIDEDGGWGMVDGWWEVGGWVGGWSDVGRWVDGWWNGGGWWVGGWVGDVGRVDRIDR